MDSSQEGILLIGTTMVLLVVFLLAVLAVMIIYQKRKGDYTQRIKSMNEKFTQELLQTQFETQQQTMQHIGREIHDNVGQKLTLASLYMHQLSEKPLDQARIESVTSVINESLTDLRSLSRDLTGEAYKYADLCQLIHKECSRVIATGSCAVNIHSAVSKMVVAEARKIFVFRIFQEFLQNSLKHAKCTCIDVGLRELHDGFEISVSDNGVGFEMTVSTAGIGIINMKRRAKIIDADLLIKSEPGTGTSMLLFVKK